MKAKFLYLILATTLCSSCAMLNNITSAFKTTYEVGKVRGKQEILKELEENKKKLKELNEIVVGEMVSLTQGQNDQRDDKVIQFLIPAMTNYLMILRERQNLKEELRVAEKTLVLHGTTSDSVPTGLGDSARIMEQEMSPD